MADPIVTDHKAAQILAVLLDDDNPRPSEEVAMEVLFSACEPLEWRVSPERAQLQLDQIKQALQDGTQATDWAVDSLRELEDALVEWEVVVPIRNPESVAFSQEGKRYDLYGCCISSLPPESLVDYVKGEPNAEIAHNYVLRHTPRAYAHTVVEALPDDSAQAAILGLRQSDFALSAVRTAAKDTRTSVMEPAAVMLAEQAIYVRLADDATDAREWEKRDLTETMPIVLVDEEVLDKARPSIRELIESARVRYLRGEKQTPLQERILGAYFLLNESGKEHSTMNRLLRLTCALEHLTTFDRAGQSRITLWMSLRSMLLALPHIEHAELRLDSLKRRTEKLRKLAERDSACSTPIALFEVLREVYTARSALSHRWAPGVAGAWYVKQYTDVLHSVVWGAMRTLQSLTCPPYSLTEDEQLTDLFNACFQTLLLLSARDVSNNGVVLKDLAFVYRIGVLSPLSGAANQLARQEIVDSVAFLLEATGMCKTTDEGFMCASEDGLAFGEELHRKFELTYRPN